MRSARVELGNRSYEAICGAGAIQTLAERIKEESSFGKAVLITDSNLEAIYPEGLKDLAGAVPVERLVVPAGEASKSFQVAEQLILDMSSLGVARDDLVVAFGGGMIGDLAGFVASIFHRGLRIAHVPTSLLAQVDASIGGKTGVNAGTGKNLAGTFHQPWLVVADTRFLDTLPEREFRSGLAEVIKYGLCFGGDILRLISESMAGLLSRDADVIEEVVHACVSCKAAVVSSDELDQGSRAVLNYGHTFGHALEAHGGYERWLHGEAIAIGMRFAAALASQMGLLDRDGLHLHDELIGRAGLPARTPFEDSEKAEMASLWMRDKKNRRDVRWVLLEGIARPVLRSDVPVDAIDRAFEAVRA